MINYESDQILYRAYIWWRGDMLIEKWQVVSLTAQGAKIRKVAFRRQDGLCGKARQVFCNTSFVSITRDKARQNALRRAISWKRNLRRNLEDANNRIKWGTENLKAIGLLDEEEL